MNTYPFWKMDGAGNDFVILDARQLPASALPTPANVQALAARSNRYTNGCDQLVVLREPTSQGCTMDIYNADGSMSGACGNVTRCVGQLLLDEMPHVHMAEIRTQAGVLQAERTDDTPRVNMGAPRLEWQDIPLNVAMDTLTIALGVDGTPVASAVSMGNPHAVMEVADVEAFALQTIAPLVQALPLFPEGVNVGIMQVKSATEMDLRVFERGVGETLSCGTGACAAVVTGVRRGVLARAPITVHTRGGDLTVEWREPAEQGGVGDVWMQGPIRLHMQGEVSV